MKEHAVADAGLHILGTSVARVVPQKAPGTCLALIGVQATKLWLGSASIINTAVTRQDPTAKRVDHMLLRVHAHLRKRKGLECCLFISALLYLYLTRGFAQH